MVKKKPQQSDIGIAAPEEAVEAPQFVCPKCGKVYADELAAMDCDCDRRFVVIQFHPDTAAYAAGILGGVNDRENGRCYEYPTVDAARAALPLFDPDPELNDPWKPHFSSEYDELSD